MPNDDKLRGIIDRYVDEMAAEMQRRHIQMYGREMTTSEYTRVRELTRAQVTGRLPFQAAREIRAIPVTAQQLAEAGVFPKGVSGEPLRITACLEYEWDGMPAVGYYIEASRAGDWVKVHYGDVPTLAAVQDKLRRIESLAMELDPGLSAWLAYHDLIDDDITSN